MGCPFHGGDEGEESSGDGDPSARAAKIQQRGVDASAFAESAVAIGGTDAANTVLAREVSRMDLEAAGDDGGAGDGCNYDVASMPYPAGSADAGGTGSGVGPDDEGSAGAERPPTHHLVVLVSYVGDDPDGDAGTVEAALASVERAFAASQRDGLAFTVGYTGAFFDRHRGDVPPVLETGSEDPVDHDVVVHLASDRASIVLAAEAALFGEADVVNGVEVEGTLGECCVRDARRSASVTGADGVPDAPAALVRASVPDWIGPVLGGEDGDLEVGVVDEGSWAGGATLRVSAVDDDGRALLASDGTAVDGPAVADDVLVPPASLRALPPSDPAASGTRAVDAE